MSDKSILKDMFSKNKISWEESESGCLVIEDGYVGFYSVFYFKEDGSLESVKAFE